GSVHLNDVALLSPFFWEGEIRGYVANVAHHVDVGGSAPGSLAVTTEVFQEGLVIPPVKLVNRGEINPDIMRFIMTHTRLPTESAGDFRAQIAANNLAAIRLGELIEKLGPESFEAYCNELIAYAERRTRADLARLPRGVHRGEDFLDSDGVTDDPIRVAVAITV